MEAVSNAVKSVETTLGLGPLAAQVLTAFVTLLVIWLTWQMIQPYVGVVAKASRKRGNSLVLFGQSGSGKTALFFRLRDGEEVQTVSSLKPLRDTLSIDTQDGEPPLSIEVVDFPGHLRYRGKAAQLITEARCIVYMLDAEDKPRMKDMAEHLYELFTNKDVCEIQPPILIAINKSDLTTARTDKFITDELEREIEQMRTSRGVTLEGEDQADSFLGIDGEKFRILEHAPCPVTMCRISVKKVQLSPLYAFLRQHFA
eukprot:TRINITY_DN51699_c0_g1_i1.p1 TRINITY_DN51699_c0_g1~~TRINITY_DN51699_c0_g1_i1.p1  ORF type:complete len:279 (+),score=62.47 TRINITY_DN51699_c0_g1_i1:67-837(+)